MKYFNLKNKSAFSLIEVLLSIALLGTIVTAVIGLIIYSQESSVLAGKRTRAITIANEGIEAVRNIRDGDFDELVDGVYGLQISSSQWQFAPTPDTTDIYTRQVEIETVNANTKLVTVTVTWEQNRQRNGSIELQTYLTRWQDSIIVGSSTGNCHITYNVVNQWSNGFNTNVTIQNLGSSAINGWLVEWAFPGNQSITSSWDSSYSQAGQNVDVTNLGYNSTIPAGGNVTFGFQATYMTNNYAPVDSEIYLNGDLCTVTLVNVVEDPGGPGPTNYCSVTYNIASQWAVGFNADVTIQNISTVAINSWLLEWTFANSETITSYWNTAITQTGANVDANNLGYNAVINPNGGTVSFGFQALKPLLSTPTALQSSNFTLNGTQCQ